MTQQMISLRFPYVPIRVDVRDIVYEGDALIDTGFEGRVILPRQSLFNAGFPDRDHYLILPDGQRASRSILQRYIGV